MKPGYILIYVKTVFISVQTDIKIIYVGAKEYKLHLQDDGTLF